MLMLIRHPRPDAKAGGYAHRCYGALDIPVDEEDVQIAAERLALLLSAHSPALLMTSPMQRCRGLANALARTLHWPPPSADDRLREINFGDWEGMAWADIPRNDLDAWAADVLGYTPPNGESVEELQRRVLSWYAEFRDAPMPVIAITHAGVIRVIRGTQEKLPLAEWTALPIPYASLTILAD